MKKYILLSLSIFAITSPWHIMKISETIEGKKVTTGIALTLQEALARTEKSDECRNVFQAVLDAAPAKDTYAHPILDHLHDQLYRFNKKELADVEMIFCRMYKVMEFSPDMTSLPQTVSKTDPEGATVSITISTPTESFAGASAFNYTYKGIFQNDNNTFMTVWWAGSEKSSKGYLIQGDNPMQQDNNTRLKYLYWDLSGSTKQVIKLWATQFGTSYLGSPAGPTGSKTGGDRGMFARLNFDSSTNAVTAQNVSIRQAKDNATAFKCVRTYFTGTLGGTISGYRPAQGTEENDNETAKGGASLLGGLGMDGMTGITDAKTTASTDGTNVAGSTLDNSTFDFSCNDLKIASQPGKAFDNNTVSYATLPDTLFPASN